MGTEWWSDDWTAWRAFVAAVFGLPMGAAELAAYRECTGRVDPPTSRQREVWTPVGRRGGKSRVLALIGVYLACCEDHYQYLDPGEWGFVLVLAADRAQAQAILNYAKAALTHAKLAPLVVPRRDLTESVDLLNNVRIAVATASIRAVRSRAVFAGLCDEIAFWKPDEESANPDAEIINALEPAMLQFPHPLLIGASSPYARKGVLWEKYRQWYGKASRPLIWKAPTVYMHPSVDRAFIDQKYEEDPASAAAEYGAEFRTDVAAFVTREAVDAVVAAGRVELLPSAKTQYRAFVDPSGGMSDSMTLAISHRDGRGFGIVDAVVEVRPPFSPDAVVAQFCEVLVRYGITSVVGDHYGGEWPRERFRERGVSYELSDRPKSDIYQAWLPLISARRCEMLDQPRLIHQVCALERKTSRAGRDTIDHPPGAHDDVANVVAGALVMVCSERFDSLWSEDDIRLVA